MTRSPEIAPSEPSAAPVVLSPCGNQWAVVSSAWLDDQHQAIDVVTGGSPPSSDAPEQARMDRRFSQLSTAPAEFLVKSVVITWVSSTWCQDVIVEVLGGGRVADIRELELPGGREYLSNVRSALRHGRTGTHDGQRDSEGCKYRGATVLIDRLHITSSL